MEPLLGGELKLAFAALESHSPNDVTQVYSTASVTADGYVINGHKSVVLNADNADKIIVVARTSEEFGAEHGLSLFLVDPLQQGIKITSYSTHDGGKAAEVELTDVIGIE